MEVYFKNLISDEGSVEKLVDDLTRVVNDANDFVQAVGGNLSAESRQEITTRLENLKIGYRRLREQTLAGARATDRWIHRNPYALVGAAFAVGLLLGARRVARGSTPENP